MIEWLLGLELTEEQALVFVVIVRIAWTVLSTRALIRSFGEYWRNRRTYRSGRHLVNGKRIIRRGRFLRSRRMFWAFSIAAALGYAALIQTYFVTPKVETSVFTVFLTLCLIVMLELFDKAKEADIDMRRQAREYRDSGADDPNAIYRRIGEEVAEGPERSIDDALEGIEDREE